MLSRRTFFGGLLGSLPMIASAARAEPSECTVFTRDRQAEVSPDDAIALLKAGNTRFREGRSVNCDLMKQISQTSQDQHPYAAIVGCIDSRVPPEIVFDQRLGDIFCARIAGNIVNVDILGSLEYATEVAGAKAIVILGHNACGAVKSAVDGVQLGNITSLLANLDPALATLKPSDGPRASHNHGLVQKVAEENARLTAASLSDRSPILKNLVDSRRLKIVAAMHDMTTGRVSWLSA